MRIDYVTKVSWALIGIATLVAQILIQVIMRFLLPSA
jgi:hypothetical protein